MKKMLRAVSVLCCLGLSDSASASDSSWPEWDRFAERFVQADGRVVDVTFDGKTTSEGQSYGLFFALVANRPDRFATLLKWTSDNLAQGQLGERLPGWLWGRRDDGTWGLKDANAASDADLWIAYSLLEAARLWNAPHYDRLGRSLLKSIREKETRHAGKVGVLLLPGPIGFELPNKRYRINPSYLPGFMFTYLSAVDAAGPWAAIWQTYGRLSPRIFRRGVAPDLFIVDSKGTIGPDSEKTPSGSYDAIRVYLWAGMSGAESKAQLQMLAPFAKLTRALGRVPEKVDPETGAALQSDFSPIGFAGAMLPFLHALGEEHTLRLTRARIQADALRARFGATTHYYDQVLILFGQGWLDGYYRFDAQGRVQPKWTVKSN